MQSIILSIINAFILSQPDLAVKPLVIQLSNYFWPSKNRRQFIKSWCKITVKPLKLKLIVCSLISIVWLQIHKNYKYVSLSNKLLTSLYKPEKKKHVLRLSPLCLAEHIKPLFSSNTFFWQKRRLTHERRQITSPPEDPRGKSLTLIFTLKSALDLPVQQTYVSLNWEDTCNSCVTQTHCGLTTNRGP